MSAIKERFDWTNGVGVSLETFNRSVRIGLLLGWACGVAMASAAWMIALAVR